MKRFCYLLLWLLTGFSIAANETAARRTLLLTASGKFCDPQEIQATGEIFSADEPASKEKPKSSLSPVNNLICSAER
ncbi:hypothetical protein I5M27_13400 [Adhaeribacter sp. BT258]|uniref:Uncharacterized protein n=1 Tax=Adhaeribacter terrigena TaxID=2793070 RepID=A0ABS1C5Z4_9BACT|nr:hypothetical protein [Adhaeribacter terrigena]MBK0403985.1 hypothetical protein [Adhaeribacter terrigena]